MAGTFRNDELMSDINVTPFVDVMLVLLIIFMVAAPMMRQGEEVSLPQVDSAPMEDSMEPLVVTMDKDGNIWLQDVQVGPGFLSSRMADLVRDDADVKVYLKADEMLPYGKVVEAMNAIRKAGVRHLGMLTQPVGVSEK